MELFPKIGSVKRRTHFFENFLLDLWVVEESSSCARVANPDAFLDDTETLSSASRPAHDHDGARTHVLFFADDARLRLRAKVSKRFGWVLKQPGLSQVVSVGDIVGGK